MRKFANLDKAWHQLTQFPKNERAQSCTQLSRMDANRGTHRQASMGYHVIGSLIE